VYTESRLQQKIASLMAEVRAKQVVSPQVEQAFCAIPRGIFAMVSLPPHPSLKMKKPIKSSTSNKLVWKGSSRDNHQRMMEKYH
jgi:protein-L-isoaspartate O-methyltransferase